MILDPNPKHPTRRDFLSFSAAIGATALAGGFDLASPAPAETGPPKRNLKLGFDNFSVRAMKWKAGQLVDHAATLGVDTVLFSDLGVYESQDEAYLRDLKAKADSAGVEIQVGTNSICPTSNAWNDKYGSPREHLLLTFRIAQALGSPVVRCYLGNLRDREGAEGIFPHIEETAKVCQSVKQEALEAGVKIAIENHAGDMQAWELVELIEKAGPDFVGATLDSGNATWTLENPQTSLEILGRYAATSGIRDSAIWEVPGGAAVQWVDMGDGLVDWNAYLERFQELCPGVAFVLEIISGGPREFHYFEPSFWEVYPLARAKDFASFVELAKRGAPPVAPSDRPTGSTEEETSQLQQLYDLERSVRFCKQTLGLGLKG